MQSPSCHTNNRACSFSLWSSCKPLGEQLTIRLLLWDEMGSKEDLVVNQLNRISQNTSIGINAQIDHWVIPSITAVNPIFGIGWTTRGHIHLGQIMWGEHTCERMFSTNCRISIKINKCWIINRHKRWTGAPFSCAVCLVTAWFSLQSQSEKKTENKLSDFNCFEAIDKGWQRTRLKAIHPRHRKDCWFMWTVPSKCSCISGIPVCLWV